MSKLEVVFHLGLDYPLYLADNTNRPATAFFPETRNTACFEIQNGSRWPDEREARGAFDMVVLRIERECEPGDRDEAHSYLKLQKWGVVQDAATVLGRVLSYLRDEDFLRKQTVNAYPAVVSDRPESNPAVRIAKAEVFFDGESITTMPLTGFPTIGVGPGVWDRVCERLARGEDVPAHRDFLLDAYYFAISGDPLRAVVMACSAWETALRRFLLDSGVRVSKRTNLVELRGRAETTKGTFLIKPFTEALAKLTKTRNKLLHEGGKDLAREDVVEMILVVDEAILWLLGP
jgi:hypothetical protein